MKQMSFFPDEIESNRMEILSYKDAIKFLLPRHYSGRKPQITYAFGEYQNGELVAVCTFGKPASHSLCHGVCGYEFENRVYELNRLCSLESYQGYLSKFVSWCLRQLKNLIVVSYSDMGMNHHGFIYQACNFIYTGQTKERTDKWTEGNKHSRHYKNTEQGKYRKVRTSKHRYIYFATKSKKLKKRWFECLNYSIKPYPKGENKNYILGEYQKPILIKVQ